MSLFARRFIAASKTAYRPSRAVSTAAPAEIPLTGTDYIEIYTGNAKQSAHWYQTVMGFQPIGFRGLETGNQEAVSYHLKQDNINIVLTSPLKKDSPIGKHISDHGDGVKRVALATPNATEAYNLAVARGAKAGQKPTIVEDKNGRLVTSSVQVYGETEMMFVEKSLGYGSDLMPGFIPYTGLVSGEKYPEVGLQFIDHMVANLDWNQMDPWCEWYRKVLGFRQLASFDDKDISTEYTALKSKVMSNKDFTVKFPLNEPATGKRKSQVEEYLNFYNGEGIQHIAVHTKDIIRTVKELRLRGCELLTTPDSYYETLHERVGDISEDMEVLKGLNILVDRDDQGYLLQIFTKPIGDRPTVFFEIIQRCGAESFGKGNFKALFVSIEDEQRKRGTL